MHPIAKGLVVLAAALALSACSAAAGGGTELDPSNAQVSPPATSVSGTSSDSFRSAQSTTPISGGLSGAASIPPTASATNTGKAWSKTEAASHFTAVTTPSKIALDTLSGLPAGASDAKAKVALGHLAATETSMIDQLAAGAWPASVVGKVNAVIAATITERDLLATLAEQPSVAAMRTKSSALPAALAAEQSAIAVVDVALGIAAK